MNSYKHILKNGLWDNNQAFVALLGLCPLLAVSNTVINGLGLGIATTLTLILSNAIVSLVRHQVGSEIRLPVFVLIIASIVTAIELTMNAFFYELYLILGIFIPLIVTNCSIIGRAEAFASKNPIGASCVDGFAMGLGFTFALVILGAMREILGSGTLFSNAHLMFGEAAKDMTIYVIDDYEGFLLAILPPGAFIGLGLLIALKNVTDKRLAQASSQKVNIVLDPKKV
ncbi:MAG: electron transport complex subunit RsxE [Cycloclasticus sp. symbiont of Poecilosclerida sp. N]|nr:MAG: electron transport complex subunit RsxE [Cycloclasticus sp. symbiont of Poecilosclerida sp. N]